MRPCIERLVATLDIVPYEPVRMAKLSRLCHRTDSNLRDILEDLVVFWRKTRRI